MDPEKETQLARWRLILGADSDSSFQKMNPGMSLSQEQYLMDQALSALYGGDAGDGGLGRGAGNGPSSPRISKWLGDVRSLFDKEIVTVIQNDAIERKGLKSLLFEPEMLEKLEPDMNLATTLLMLKDHVPKRSKESVRAFIAKIVEQINRLMEEDMRRAVVSALKTRKHTPLPSASALDFPLTIRRNLKNYNPELKTIIPEKFYFFDRVNRANHWTVIVDVDQSGSMGQSVVYSSVMSCILASMSAIKTHIVAFDTQVVDLTEKSDDPVDLLYGFQLGGGTDIHKSVAYCQQFITTPSKTLFFLITDLDEGGNMAGLMRRLEDMKDSGVTVVCLLAIEDGGKPYYNEYAAQRVARMGIPCFACSPPILPELLSAAFKGQDLSRFGKQNKPGKTA